MADGSITFSTELDNKKLEQQLQKARKEIEKLEESASAQEAKKSPLVQQAHELEESMRAAREEVRRYGSEWAAGVAGADKNQSEAVIQAQQLEAQHAKVVAQIDKIDQKLQPAYTKLDRMKETAGGLEQELSKASRKGSLMGDALNRAETYMDKFVRRVKGLARRVFVFTVITSMLRSLKNWMADAIKTDDKARASIARLKGALLTLAQPLVDVVIPAFTAFANILADLVSQAAGIVSTLFGSTAEESAKSAEELYDEQSAIKGVGDAAKKAGKAMANFDEINKLPGSGEGQKEIEPDFSGVGEKNWLKDTLGEVAGMVADALMLGGIALVAIGAATGNLPLVVTGLVLLGVGLSIGGQTDTLQSWADALGLNSVQEFVVVAVTLAGIALVAIGAAMGNILFVLAGLGLIWGAIAYSNSSGMMNSWTEEQLSRAATYITAALILGGIVLVAIGAATANVLMVLAGLGLIAAGIYVGTKSGVLKPWMEVLGLESVFDYVLAAIQLVGIALICIGAAMGNIFMVIAGGLLIAAAGIAKSVGEETLMAWWEKLQLTTVMQWVGVALLLVGVALIAIGAMMGNILMVVAGAVMIGAGMIASMDNNNLSDWVTTLGLEKVVGWVTAALMLAGMAFIFFGILTVNVLMVVSGVGLIIAGFVVGTESGTFGSWVDALGLSKVSQQISTAIQLAGIAFIAIGALMTNPLMIIAGLALLGVGTVLRGANQSKAKAGAMPQVSRAMPSVAQYDVPALAKGAVIPPNREFLAVLGDQKSGTNIEAPASEIESAVTRGIQQAGGGNGGPMEIKLVVTAGDTLARDFKFKLDRAAQLQGVRLVNGGAY